MGRIAAATCVVFAAAACGASAADYPVRPIRLVVGFAAGGPTDIPARFVAEKLGDRLAQRVGVQNKPAAGGMLPPRDRPSPPKKRKHLPPCPPFHPRKTAFFKNASYT